MSDEFSSYAYLLLIRHPILEVGHLGLLWPSPAPARGRPGRKPSDGITARIIGRTRPETPTAGAPYQFRAGSMAPGTRAAGSRLAVNNFKSSIFLIELYPFPLPSLGCWERVSTGIEARAPTDQIAVATSIDFPSPTALHGSRVQRANCCLDYGTVGRFFQPRNGVKGDPYSYGGQNTRVTSQSSSSKIGAAIRPFPPSKGTGSPESWDAPPPSKSSRSLFLGALSLPRSQLQVRHYPRIPDSRFPALLPSQLPAPGGEARWRMVTA